MLSTFLRRQLLLSRHFAMTASETVHVPVVIIGSGPSGLTAGIYAGRAGLSPVIAAGSVSGTNIPGGQLMITTEVSNYPGFPDDITGPELMERMFSQAKRFGCQIIEEFVTDVSLKQGGPHKVSVHGEPSISQLRQVLVGKDWYSCDALIIANGAKAQWLNAPGESDFVNRGISACATCDGPLPVFRNKRIFVVGGGDSACEEALFLAKFASKVSIIHRRDKLRASKAMADRVFDNPKIEVLYNKIIAGYAGQDRLESIVLQDTVSNETQNVEAGGLFMAIGHSPNTAYLKKSGIEMDEAGYIKVRDNVFTNIEGVFTCGDCHDQTYRQAITAAGFGCMAAISCERWLEA